MPARRVTVDPRHPRIQEEPNPSACPGRIDGDKADTFDPDKNGSAVLDAAIAIAERESSLTTVEVY